ncbi:LPS export ABC transporter permease LptG [Candidatus Profftia sp. (ex Adelges kitamiensis)]|uniref:LPS export ABC transporter permease LptG n=1 Tax=Candidatus Profftia sp. (ex Adelges kitamiensis) TaxID=2864218 RepID=UPI001CE2F509|nr:LPS export ABC transporter permease LptG [Candidatus Profftia sp. (ex Adelges kitamiensis)]
MLRVLDRYIGRNIFNTIMITLFMIVSLSSIIKFIDQLRKVGQGHYSALDAGFYTLLSVPKDIEVFFPMSALLGTLLSLGILARYSELVVMQSSGYTRLQISFSVMKTTIPLVILTMIIGEWVAPAGEQAARNYRAQCIYGGSLLSTQNGLWVKDGNDFIFIQHITGENCIQGISIYSFNDQHYLKKIVHANSAMFEGHYWKLSQVNEFNFTNITKITNLKNISGIWQTNLIPDKLCVVAMNPDSLSISGLYNYVKYLKKSRQEFARYQLKMWNKIFTPLSVAIMMLIVLSCIFGPLHNALISVIVLTGTSFGFLFYILDNILGSLCLVYGISPVIGALLPSLLFFLISIYMLFRKC